MHIHRGTFSIAWHSAAGQVIYESETHNGVGELLEILGSIINGGSDNFGRG